MNNKYTVVQGVEPNSDGGDTSYWMVTSGQSGFVMGVFDTELEANNHVNLLTANRVTVTTVTEMLAPLAELQADSTITLKADLA